MHEAVAKAPIPDNVPPERVVDFDVYAPPGGERDLHGAWRKLWQEARDRSLDIVWTPYHGGHWLPLRYDDIEFIERNHDPFSMRDITMPAGLREHRLLPIETDPPEHTGFRAIVNPFFTPKSIGALEPFTRDLAIKLIEGFKPNGRCEFVGEFALQLPIAIFMRLADLPFEDAPELLGFADMAVRGGPEVATLAQEKIIEYVLPVIEERRRNPGEDLLSAVLTAKIDGKPLRDQDVISMAINVLSGGLDTVASTMGFIADFLARHPQHRRQLVEDPSLLPAAVNEMMRRFAPASTARTMTRDYDFKGLHFKRGDKVYVSTLVAGLDESRYTNAWDVDFLRKEGRSAAFGAGPHTCPGQLLALLELRVFIQEWLKRIPDFRISESDPEARVFGSGQVNCVRRLVLEWDV